MNITRKSTRGPLGLLLGLWLCCSAAQAQLTAIVAVEPTARKAAHSILRTSAESGLSKAAGQPVALTTSDDLADVMRATRSAGYDIFIGPAQVAASALQRGYELVGFENVLGLALDSAVRFEAVPGIEVSRALEAHRRARGD